VPDSLDDVLPGLLLGLGTTKDNKPIFQAGNGCLADQLVGQYMAHVTGLGYLLQPDNVRSAMQSVFRYNFLEEMYKLWNPLRTYAASEESALIVCTWPYGDPPEEPFFRAPEAWTGCEYQAAAHMIYEGLVAEGLRVVKAVRDRHDGARRNPWDEPECGHHYARAMASWAVLLALSGFQYSAVSRQLGLAPRWKPEAFRGMWTVPTGWGTAQQTIGESRLEARWEALWGELVVARMRYELPEGARLVGAEVLLGDDPQPALAHQQGSVVEILLEEAVKAVPGSALVVNLDLLI
jgi:hypothetical protein